MPCSPIKSFHASALYLMLGEKIATTSFDLQELIGELVT